MNSASVVSITMRRSRGVVICALLTCALFAQSHPSQVYINSFQGGRLVGVDPAKQQTLWSAPVEDGSGIIGAAVSSDGAHVFVVDGDQQNFVRVLDSSTGKQLAKYEFQNRLRLLSGGPVIHLTADNRWLFVKTYDDASAASGVRIFDVERGQFAPAGLHACDCGSPLLVSARDGRLVAVCQNELQEFRSQTNINRLVPVRSIEMPIRVAVGAVLTSGGKTLYVLGQLNEGRDWVLAEWTEDLSRLTTHDLRKLLNSTTAEDEDRPWMDASPDGSRLAFVLGTHVWILEASNLRVLHFLDLPWPAEKAAFSADGTDLFTLRSYRGGEKVDESILLRVSVKTGELSKIPLTLTLARSVAVLLSAPAP